MSVRCESERRECQRCESERCECESMTTEATEEKEEAADAALKARTPHRDVGK